MRKHNLSRPATVTLAVVALVGLVLSPLPTFTQGVPVRPAAAAQVAGQPFAALGATTTPLPTSSTPAPGQGEGIPIITSTPTRTPTPIQIGNLVWDDLDHDGRQDGGEPGLANVTVQLWNSAKTSLIDTDLTDANGNYRVVAPVPGDYRLRVLLPSPSLDEFSPKDQAGGNDQLDSDINPSGRNFGFSDVMTLGSNLISTVIWDAGIILYRPPTPTRTPTPIQIGNLVWFDVNGDGVQADTEAGLADITVQLWNEAKTSLIDTDLTDANGIYRVVAPVPGNYRVRVVLAQGGAFTLKDQGNDNDDSDINPSGPNAGFTDTIVLDSFVISTLRYDAGLVSLPTVTATPTFLDIFLPNIER